jgi:hypothetical protein
MYCRQLPAQLSAATKLTSLTLGELKDAPLSIAASALPCSMQRLRLTEGAEPDAADHSEDDDDPQHDNGDAAEDSHPDAASLPRLQRHFHALSHLQNLQLTVYSRGVQSLPTG